MNSFERLGIGYQALRELGIERLSLYARYQLGLRSGIIEQMSRSSLRQIEGLEISPEHRNIINLPEAKQIEKIIGGEVQNLLSEADQICEGRIFVFGNQKQELTFFFNDPLIWFTNLDIKSTTSKGQDFEDVKLIWEPARFCWIYPLARAYILTGNENYCETFWNSFDSFIEHNPPYYGVQWLSAQEVAIRLISWVFAIHVFRNSPLSNATRIKRLKFAVACHAARIPCTLSYARAQNNNHLLSEAAGLLTASLYLKELPIAQKWFDIGWYWFNRGLQKQIEADGSYVQHSTNYHRLMLQLALWVNRIIQGAGLEFPAETLQKLNQATRWLSDMCVKENGDTPNFGANDGAYIQPLSEGGFRDVRPVVQAAGRAFSGKTIFQGGVWDEMSLWYGVNQPSSTEAIELTDLPLRTIHPRSMISIFTKDERLKVFLRCAKFRSRPGHADQLHLDVWYCGVNVARDAGTYRYTAPPPWDNSLAESFYHNTLSVQKTSQMQKAGRFLWLNWAQAYLRYHIVDPIDQRIEIQTEHNGYRRFGVKVERKVDLVEERLLIVEDRIHSTKNSRDDFEHPVHVQLHWLLADSPWQVGELENGWMILLDSKAGNIPIRITSPGSISTDLSIMRGGEVVYGTPRHAPVYGWYSPTYNYKEPALSVILEGLSSTPFSFVTIWEFPPVGNKG